MGWCGPHFFRLEKRLKRLRRGLLLGLAVLRRSVVVPRTNFRRERGDVAVLLGLDSGSDELPSVRYFLPFLLRRGGVGLLLLIM